MKLRRGSIRKSQAVFFKLDFFFFSFLSHVKGFTSEEEEKICERKRERNALKSQVSVVGCTNLKNTEWISRQDPYVRVEYANTKFRTRTCTDVHKNPTFQDKFVFSLIEGLWELSVNVWNSSTLSNDDFIGSGRVQLKKVLFQGYDDAAWTLQCKSDRFAGEDLYCIMRI